MEVDPIDEVAFAGEVTAEERTAAAIKQANDTMGLPSQGPLPQQVAALVAALGIRV